MNRMKKAAGSEAKFSRARHSAGLRRFQYPRETEIQENRPTAERDADEQVLNVHEGEEPLRAAESEGAAEPDGLRVVSRKRDCLIVEQVLQHRPGPGKPLASVELRLTTALRGQRRQDGLIQAAYLLRLEILNLSPGARVEGFSLGPWRSEGLALEVGSIAVPEPFWSAFQPRSGHAYGRLLLADTPRNRLLDFPWAVEGILPSPEPFPG